MTLAAGSPEEKIDLDFASDFEMCASSVYTIKPFALSRSIPPESKIVEGGRSWPSVTSKGLMSVHFFFGSPDVPFGKVKVNGNEFCLSSGPSWRVCC